MGKHLRRERDKGASLIEFALAMPLLLILVLGIVEFGWLLGQFNDVRHGSREGARYAAVDGGDVVDHVCSAMEGLTAGMTNITIALDRQGNDIGDSGEITVTANVTGLSNAPIISSFLPSTLSSTVEFRLEQVPTWGTGNASCP